MRQYHELNLQEKARFLVDKKGEISVELWNDRAQCVLAPMLQEHQILCKRVVSLEKARACLAKLYKPIMSLGEHDITISPDDEAVRALQETEEARP